MSTFIGRRVEVGLGAEAVRGTKVEPSVWMPKTEATIDDRSEVLINEQSLGRIEDAIGGDVTLEWSEGDISGRVTDNSIGLLLYAALGAVSSGEEGEGHKHDFTVLNSASHPSLTVECYTPNEQLAFPLAMLNSLEITGEVGGAVEYTASFISKRGETATTETSYVDQHGFLGRHAIVKIADDLSGLGGASAIAARSFTLTITKNAERSNVVGQAAPDEIHNKQFSVTFNAELVHKNTTYKTNYRDGEIKAIRLEIENDDVDLGGSLHPKLTVDLASAITTEWERTAGLDDIVTESFDAKALYCTDDSQMIVAELINDVEAYEPNESP